MYPWPVDRQDLPEEARRFWDDTEELLGERVEVFAMARCDHGCDPTRTDLWGLLFFTSQAVYFRHFPQQSFLRNLVRSGKIGERVADAPLFLRVEYITLASVEVVRDVRLTKRLFGRNQYRLIIRHTAVAESPAHAGRPEIASLGARGGEPVPTAEGVSDVIHISVEQHAFEVLDFLRHNDAFSGLVTERRGHL